MITASKSIDLRGLRCPVPLLKARKALALLEEGQWLEVLLTDPGSIKDFFAFAEQNAFRIEFSETESGDFLLWLQCRSIRDRGVGKD